MAMKCAFCVLALAVLLGACSREPAEQLTQDQVQAIARDAYVYGFPMVMNYKTMYEYAVNTESPDYKGPLNQVACEARLFTPDDRAVVTPNADTPYCMFWMDLRAEPLVLSVPELEAGSLLQLPAHRFLHAQLRLRR